MINKLYGASKSTLLRLSEKQELLWDRPHLTKEMEKMDICLRREIKEE